MDKSVLPGAALGERLDACQVMIPKLFKVLDPVVNCFKPVGVEAVNPLLALFKHSHDSDFAQHAKVLGHSRLRMPQQHNQCSHGQGASRGKQFENLPSPRFGDGIKHIGCCTSTSHTQYYSPILEYVKRLVQLRSRLRC